MCTLEPRSERNGQETQRPEHVDISHSPTNEAVSEGQGHRGDRHDQTHEKRESEAVWGERRDHGFNLGASPPSATAAPRLDVTMAVRSRIVRLRTLGAEAFADLFDQRSAFGRLALVQVLMIAGDMLVTISLAGSLFFSISPTEAKSKVLLYLLLTIAPFAVVSPLLGPLIDRSRGARRAMVVFSGVGRAALCPFMARDIHSLLLFPEAFLILVLSKLYLVTRGALVPEIAEADHEVRGHEAADAYLTDGSAQGSRHGLAGWNAQLTLLGTLAGFVISIPGVTLLKTTGATGVLIFDTAVFAVAAIAGLRLKLPRRRHRAEEFADASWEVPTYEESYDDHDEWGADTDPDLVAIAPVTHPEVILGLSANSILRGIAGFLVFLLAFGLRRSQAALYWYGLALGASGVGALIGLALVPRLRRFMREPQMLLLSLAVVCLSAIGAAEVGGLPIQAVLSLMVGVVGAIGQPSFDAMTQRYVPVAAQGRAFARFATRQQLIWVIGAVIPVAIALSFVSGDWMIAGIAGAAALWYLVARIRRVPRGRRMRGQD